MNLDTVQMTTSNVSIFFSSYIVFYFVFEMHLMVQHRLGWFKEMLYL